MVNMNAAIIINAINVRLDIAEQKKQGFLEHDRVF